MKKTTISKTFLQIKHITKHFPKILTLNNIQFSLHRNEIHTLLNKNNTKKSTLIKILSKIYQPNKNEIIFKNKPISFSNPLNTQNINITIIHQKFNLFPELTIKKNIFIDKKFYKKNR